MDVGIVRWFNLVYTIGLSLYLIYRLRQKRYAAYKWANVAYLFAFLYSISAYSYTFLTNIPFSPILSALGATVQTSAIMAAIISQVGENK